MLAPLSQLRKDHKTVMLQSNSTQPLKIPSSNVLPFHEVKKDSVSHTEPHHADQMDEATTMRIGATGIHLVSADQLHFIVIGAQTK